MPVTKLKSTPKFEFLDHFSVYDEQANLARRSPRWIVAAPDNSPDFGCPNNIPQCTPLLHPREEIKQGRKASISLKKTACFGKSSEIKCQKCTKKTRAGDIFGFEYAQTIYPQMQHAKKSEPEALQNRNFEPTQARPLGDPSHPQADRAEIQK